MPSRRRLAAILAADVAGFSARMGSDEDGTLAALQALRAVVDPVIEGHGGRIANTAGDSVIAEFLSVAEAVDAAVEVQRSPEARATGLRLRIGVNLGDVIVADDGDVFGDGVNVAARLEGIAPTGGIVVSASVRDSLRGRSSVSFEDLGEHRVKHIAEPISVFRALLDDDPPAAARPIAGDTETPELLERIEELGILSEALDAAQAGRGRLALVTGEAGIGKSVLVDVFTARAPATVEVLWGWCDDLVTPRALGPFHDMAGSLGPGFVDALDREGRPEMVLRALYTALSDGTTRIVVIEDLHWADDATLDAITFLARRIAGIPTLLVATVRDVGAPRVRAAIAEAPSGSVVRLHPEPLSAAAIARLTGDAAEAERLRRLTGGNPFFVSEVVGTTGDDVPSSVQDAVLGRLDRLGPDGRRVAEIVSVVPARVEIGVVAELADGVSGLAEAEAARLLVVTDGWVGYRHELARQAVESALGERARVDLHSRVLGALDASGADPARLVHHAEGAKDVDAVVKHALAAARTAAAVGAHRESASHYERVLAHDHLLDREDLVKALEAYSHEAFLLDRDVPSIEAAERLHRIHQADGNVLRQGDNLRWLSRLHWWKGDGVRAGRLAAEAIDALQPLGPTPELARALSNRSQLAMLAHDDDEAIHWGEQAMQLADDLGDDATYTHALINVGTTVTRSDPDRGTEMLREAVRRAHAAGIEDEAMRARANIGWYLIVGREYTAAETELLEGLRLAEAHEVETFATYLRGALAWLNLEIGRWDEADRLARESLGQKAPSAMSRMPSMHTLATIAARTGRRAEARRMADDMWGLAVQSGESQRIGPAAATLAEIAWLESDTTWEASIAVQAHDTAVAVRDRRWSGELARWLRLSGHELDPADYVEPYRSEVAGDLEGAATRWRAFGCPYEEALCLAENSRLDAAAAIFERLGATAALQRIGR